MKYQILVYITRSMGGVSMAMTSQVLAFAERPEADAAALALASHRENADALLKFVKLY